MENLMNEIMEESALTLSYYVLVDSDSRITMVTAMKQGDDQFLFEFPLDFDFSDIINWKIVDGELVNEPVEIPEPTPGISLEERVTSLEDGLVSAEQSITEMDLRDIETEQTITEMDLRLLELEG